MWHRERMLHTLTVRNRHRSLSLQGREGGTEMCPNVAVINECFKPCKRELFLKEVSSREVKMIVVFAAACFDRRVCGVCSTGHSTRSMPWVVSGGWWWRWWWWWCRRWCSAAAAATTTSTPAAAAGTGYYMLLVIMWDWGVGEVWNLSRSSLHLVITGPCSAREVIAHPFITSLLLLPLLHAITARPAEGDHWTTTAQIIHRIEQGSRAYLGLSVS